MPIGADGGYYMDENQMMNGNEGYRVPEYGEEDEVEMSEEDLARQ